MPNCHHHLGSNLSSHTIFDAGPRDNSGLEPGLVHFKCVSPLSSRYSSTLRPSAAVCSCQLWIWCRHSGQLHHCPGAAVQHRQEQQCNTVQEQQCKTVQDTVNEQVCESVQEQECNTVYDEVCDSAQPTYGSGGFGGSARGSGSSSSGASSG